MGTSSAIPSQLLRHAAGTRHAAELLAGNRARLEAAQQALLATHPDPALLGPLPDAAGELSRLTALTFALGAFTEQVGAAFRRADTGIWSGPVRASDGALAAQLTPTTALVATAPLLADLEGAGPAERRAIVECLPDVLIGDLVEADAAFMGNAPGIPEPVRYRANLHHLVTDLQRALASFDFHAMARLEALLRTPGGGPPQILLYEPEEGRVAMVFGDLVEAGHVAVLVPGCGSTFDNFGAQTARQGRNLFEAASSVAAGDVAVIAWLGYDAPPLIRGGLVGPARAGARELATLLFGLQRTPGSRLTLVGHSYGSVVVGETMAYSPTVDDIVVLGSPGMGVDRAADLRLPPTGQVYAEVVRGDPVGHLEAYGTAPTSGAFGGVRLTTNEPGRTPIGGGSDAHAHSQYFVPGSEALANTALVVAGRGVDAERQQETPGEKAADADRGTDRLVHPDGEALDELAEHYHGPGHELVDGADRVSRTERAAEHTAVRYGVDGAEKLADALSGLVP